MILFVIIHRKILKSNFFVVVLRQGLTLCQFQRLQCMGQLVVSVWNPLEISEGKTRLLVLEFSRLGQIWFPEAEIVVLHSERSIFVPYLCIFATELR